MNAMGRGMPVTTTPDGLRGLGFSQSSEEHPLPLCIASDAPAFARCLHSQLTDDGAWRNASNAGLEHIARVLSPTAQRRAVRSALATHAHTPEAPTPSVRGTPK